MPRGNPTLLRRARLAALAAPQTAAVAAGPALEIASLEFWPLREPVSKRAYTVVRLRTRSGIAGYGECRGAPAAEWDRARRLLSGKEATATESIRRLLSSIPAVQGAINIALLDIVGRHARAPVYQLFGGPTRNKARALAPLNGISNSELQSSLAAARQAGFRAATVPVPPPAAPNQGQAFVRAAAARLEQLRSAAGEGFDFVLDGGASLSPGDAASLAAAVERFHVLWFDEPCRLVNLDAIRKISGETVTPLGFGRGVDEASVFQDLLREEVIDILRPDLGANGISRIRRMAALAETYYTAVAPWHAGGPVATAAALHLAAALPNFFIQQAPFPPAEEDRRMRAELAGKSLEAPREGFFELPTGPGLGIQVNPDALERYKERAA